MDNSELLIQLTKLAEPLFTDLSIESVNHTPHPYCIGSRHVAHAADKFNGILSEDAIKAAEAKGIKCAVPHCGTPYKEHTSDTVLFLKLTRTVTHSEAREVLLKLVPLTEANNIDGFGFLETPDQFRITEE